MQREIKFREPIFIDGVFKSFHYWGFIDGIFIGPMSRKYSQQFTGLHDKNGKDIYEEDILKHHIYKTKVFMEFKDGAFSQIYPLCDFEVIGNTYENPELL